MKLFKSKKSTFFLLIAAVAGAANGLVWVNSEQSWGATITPARIVDLVVRKPNMLQWLLYSIAFALISLSVVYFLYWASENRSSKTFIFMLLLLCSPIVGGTQYVGIYPIPHIIFVFIITLFILLAVSEANHTSIENRRSYFHILRNLICSARANRGYLLLTLLTVLVVYSVLPGFNSLEQPTGDEPNYLLTAHSLVRDRDLNLENNYLKRDYRLFYGGTLHHRVSRLESGEWLPSQGIGLPILISAAYAWGMKQGDVVVAVRRFMAFLSLICMWITALFVRGNFENNQSSLVAVAVIAGSGPFLYYTHQLYPEIPAALVFAAVCLTSRSTSVPRAFISGLLVGSLPWLGIKFIVPLTFILLNWMGWMIADMVSSHATGKMKISRALVVKFASALFGVFMFFIGFYMLYGSFDFVGTHGIRSNSGHSFGASLLWTLKFGIRNANASLRIALGYLFDQRVGILLYSPITVVLPLGIWRLWKQNRKLTLLTVSVVASHWALFSWTGQWEGYCPPIRYLVPCMPFFALWLSALFEKGIRWNMAGMVIRLLTFFSLVEGLYIFIHLNRFYHFVLWRNPLETNHFLQEISSDSIDLTPILPSFVDTNIPILPVVFLGFAVIFIANLWGKKAFFVFSTPNNELKRSSSKCSELTVRGFRNKVLLAWILVIIMLFTLHFLVYQAAHPSAKFSFNGVMSQRKDLYSMNLDTFPPEPNGCWLRSGGTARIFCARGFPPKLKLHSLIANSVILQMNGRRLILEIEPSVVYTLNLHPNQEKPNQLWLHIIRGIRPVELNKASADRRNLGCFIEFEE